MKSLRIAVADDEPLMRAYLQQTLTEFGHEVVGLAENGRELVDVCHGTRPDLVITDIKMPEMDGIEAVAEICRTRCVPAVLVSAYHLPEIVEQRAADCVFSYLIKPIKQPDIPPAINMAIKRFEQFEDMRNELAEARQQLVDRKKIERAKGIIMKLTGLDEGEAFRRLLNMARSRNMKAVDLAESILLSDEAFGPLRTGLREAGSSG